MSKLKTALLLIAASLLSTAPARAVIDHPEKIGIAALSRTGTSKALDDLGFPFYYTWSTQPVKEAAGDSVFIPMIRRAENLNDPVPKGSGYLLGFNEPFRPDQYMSPDRAVELWPRLQAHGLRLGSPATSPGSSTLGPNSWLGQFLEKADARNYRVDFIAIHYYSRDGDIEKFRYFLQKVYDTYKKPIWVTEWALHDHSNTAHKFTTPQMVDFAKRGLEMLDNLPFVKRHMWYKTHNRGVGDMPTQVLDVNSDPTAVGEVFRSALRGGNFGHETIDVPDNLVPNPGFEDGEDVRWQFYWRRNMGSAQVVAGTSHTGMSSLKMGTGATQVSNDITYRTSPGRTYQISAWTRLGQAGEKASIGVKMFDAGGRTVANVVIPITSTTFKNVEGSFTIPGNADRVVINIYKNAGSSHVYIDDVAVVAR